MWLRHFGADHDFLSWSALFLCANAHFLLNIIMASRIIIREIFQDHCETFAKEYPGDMIHPVVHDVLFRSAAQTISDWLYEQNHFRNFKAGMICGLHTFGRDSK